MGRDLDRRGLLAAGLTLGALSACTRSRGPGKPAPSTSSDPAGPVDVLEYDASLAARTRLSGVTSALPAGIAFPPRQPASDLLQDLPGRVLGMTLLDGPDVTGFADQQLAMIGVDGRWRRLSMAQLDLDPTSYYGPDSGWAGTLSPDGRWWRFPESLGPGEGRRWTVLDLETGARNTYDPDGGQTISATWTARSTLVFTRSRPDRARTVIDPSTGTATSTRALPGLAEANLVYGPGGRAHRITLEEPAGLETYDERLRLVDRLEAPFAFPRDGKFTPIAAARDGFALIGQREGTVVVTDAELRPLSELRTPGRLPWDDLAWIDDDTVLLWSAIGYGGTRGTPVVAWRPRTREVSRLSTLLAPTLTTEAVVPTYSPAAFAAG